MNKGLPSIIISGLGVGIPDNAVTNDDLSQKMDTSDEWIRSRTGIGQRYIADSKQHASDLGVLAADAALKDAGIDKQDIDLLVCGTMSPDYPLPATACLIQSKLGLRNIGSFDVHAACSGFVYIIEVATRMLQAGNYKNALVIGAEKMSSVIDWDDRATCVLFGDGAGAVVLSKSDLENVGVLDSFLGSDGSKPESLYLPAGGSVEPLTPEGAAEHRQFLKMNGREIFKSAVRLMGESCERVLERNQLTSNDISCIIPHQANVRIIDSLIKHLDIPREKWMLNIDRYANTSAASIPIALVEARKSGRIKNGDYVLLVAFGGGLTWGATLIKWPNE